MTAEDGNDSNKAPWSRQRTIPLSRSTEKCEKHIQPGEFKGVAFPSPLIQPLAAMDSVHDLVPSINLIEVTNRDVVTARKQVHNAVDQTAALHRPTGPHAGSPSSAHPAGSGHNAHGSFGAPGALTAEIQDQISPANWSRQAGTPTATSAG